MKGYAKTDDKESFLSFVERAVGLYRSKHGVEPSIIITRTGRGREIEKSLGIAVVEKQVNMNVVLLGDNDDANIGTGRRSDGM